MNTTHKEFLNFAEKFLDKSSKILINKFNGKFSEEEKMDGSFVTEIDKEIENLFISSLKMSFPKHGLIGEEFGKFNISSDFIWVIDPLDGTHSFISGKPLFGTLICLIINKKPALGMIDIPVLSERWIGGLKSGITFNKKKCPRFSNKKSLSNSIVSSTSLLMFEKRYYKKLKRIYQKSKFPIFGTDCYAYGLMLNGKIDLIIEANMKPWDFLAQVPLIKEAGGYITDWDGKELNLNSNGRVIASSSKKCYQEALEILSES